MRYRTLMLAGIVVIGLGSLIAAREDHKEVKVKTLGVYEMTEKLDNLASNATVIEVRHDPGQVNPPHRHPGAVFGYVAEGEYEWAINDEPAKVLKPGDTFYEPKGCLHRVSKNPGKVKSRVIVWMVHARDEKRMTIPEPKK